MAKKQKDNLVLIEVPVVAADESVYRSRHINTRLTQRQADAARLIFDGLYDIDATLASGHHVDTPADAIKWLLEQVAESVQPASKV